MKKHITKVIFRQFADGDIIALFPEVSADLNYNNCLSYMQIGQHSSANVSIYHDTFKPYTGKTEAIEKELKTLGYNLKIVSRFSYEMDRKRIEEINKTREFP